MLEIMANFAWHEARWMAQKHPHRWTNRRINHAISKVGGFTWFTYQAAKLTGEQLTRLRSRFMDAYIKWEAK